MDNPLVSIITQVLNGIKYLEACLQSVLNQSYPYIEHILVDGCSTDGTVEMLASYQAKYPDRIRFISEPDKGAEEAFNKGLVMAKGEILGWLGSDDVYEPNAIQIVVEFFRANPDACFVFGDCNNINEKGEIVGKYPTKDFNLEETINNSCHIPAPSAFYKREVIEKVGGVDTSGRTNSDVDYWIRVGKVFPIHRIEKTLSNFRAHQDKRNAIMTDKMIAREDFIMSRRHGGRLFSRRARIYFWLVIIDPLRPILNFPIPLLKIALRPILGFAYPFLSRVLRKLMIR